MTTQVVFVHGVATRDTPEYQKIERGRDEKLKKFIFGDDTQIYNPKWGRFGANPPSGNDWRSLPKYGGASDVESLSVGARAAAQGEAVKLVDLARENFADTVDLIYAEVFSDLEENDQVISDAIIVAAERAAAYAENEPAPRWLTDEMNNDQFLEELRSRAEGFARAQRGGAPAPARPEQLGVGSWLRDGARRLVDRIRNAGGRLILSKKRASIHNQVAAFAGDIFRYLKDNDGRTNIRAVVTQAVSDALSASDKTVLIGHSLGGVILVDCLGDAAFRRDVGLDNGRNLDLLVTVGSQPGLFRELGLLGFSEDHTVKPQLADVGRWLNIYDELDALSFRAATVFGGNVQDFAFSSGTGLFSAHTAYFHRPQFYHRLRKRVADAGVPVVDVS